GSRRSPIVDRSMNSSRSDGLILKNCPPVSSQRTIPNRLLVVLDLGELGVDDVVVLLRLGAGARIRTRLGAALGGGGEALGGGFEGRDLGLDLGLVVALHHRLQVLRRFLDATDLVARD